MPHFSPVFFSMIGFSLGLLAVGIVSLLLYAGFRFVTGVMTGIAIEDKE